MRYRIQAHTPADDAQSGTDTGAEDAVLGETYRENARLQNYGFARVERLPDIAVPQEEAFDVARIAALKAIRAELRTVSTGPLAQLSREVEEALADWESTYTRQPVASQAENRDTIST